MSEGKESMEQWKWVPYRTLEKQSDPPQSRNWAGQVEFLRNLQAIQDNEARTKFSPADRVEPISFDRQRTISMDLYTNPKVGQWRKDYGDVLVNEYHVKPPQWFIDRVNAVGGSLSGGAKATARASGVKQRKPKGERKVPASPRRKVKSKEESRSSEDSENEYSEEEQPDDELLQSMQSLRVTPPEPARRKRHTSPPSVAAARSGSDTIVMVRLLAISVEGQVLPCEPQDEIAIDLTEESEAQMLKKFNIHFDETQMIKLGWFESDGTYSSHELFPGVHATSLNYAAGRQRFGHHLWTQWSK
jgi:hypothetical protein